MMEFMVVCFDEAVTKRPRILLADDHRLLREAFTQLLEPTCEVVGAVADGRALVAMAAEQRPDIVVLDIAMPLLNGLDAARQLKRTMPEVKVIFLTMSEDPDVAAEAFRAGASGYLLKNSAASELLQAIQEVFQGRSYVTPQATQGLVDNFLRKPDDTKGARALSPRQREVLQLLAEGHAMKEIARILKITPRTVAFHKYTMMEELGIKSTAMLIQFALKQGLVSV
jgi:DNA-binding NarL/FixJ family response regulator